MVLGLVYSYHLIYNFALIKFVFFLSFDILFNRVKQPISFEGMVYALC